MRVLFLLCCFLFVVMFWPHTAEAQCSRGACGPAVIQHWAPMQATAHVGIVTAKAAVVVAVAPVRAVARTVVAVRERRVVARALTAPFRLFRGGCRCTQL